MSTKFSTRLARSVLRLAGKDALPFVQNLVTADCASLSQGGSVYAALLTPQGKILFDFFLIGMGEAILIDCAQDQALSLKQRLTMYKLRSDVTIEDVGEFSVFACSTRPDATDCVFVFEDPRLKELGYRVIATPEQAGTLESGGAEEHEKLQLQLGIADSGRDLKSGEYFPHEANLDQLGAVSFSKGCYIGQEVVSRMEHRGTARSRMVPVTAADTFGEGDDIKAGELKIGTLLSRSGQIGLALVRLDRLQRAIESGERPEIAGNAVTVRKPDWARYEFPAEGGN